MNQSGFVDDEQTYLDQVKKHLPFSFEQLTSYIPDSFPQHIRIGPYSVGDPPAERKRTVLWKSFESYTHDGKLQLFMLLGLTTGLQIYKVFSTSDIRRVAEWTDGPVGHAKFLWEQEALCVNKFPAVQSSPDSRSARANLGPLIALVSAQHPGDHQVKIYSLCSRKVVHVRRFRSRVYALRTGPRALIVCLKREIQLFNTQSSNFDHVWTLPCFPQTEGSFAADIGPRWIAYAGCEALPTTDQSKVSTPSKSSSPSPISSSPGMLTAKQDNMPPPLSLAPVHSAAQSLSSVLTTSFAQSSAKISNATKEMASTLYTLGDTGRKKLVSHIARANGVHTQNGSGTHGLSVPDGVAASGVGTVVVRDIFSQQIITQFQAHSVPIEQIMFDPSGMLMVTAPEHGQYIHVYQVVAIPSPSGHSYTSRQLYRCFRGITHARIRDISFSLDSKWCAVTSERGTVHIYAINTLGGECNMKTHGLKQKPSALVTAQRPHPLYTPQSMDVSAVYRLKQKNEANFVYTGAPHESYCPIITCLHPLVGVDQLESSSDRGSCKHGRSTFTDKLLVLTDHQQLVVYDFEVQRNESKAPEAAPAPDSNTEEDDSAQLQLDMTPISTWDFSMVDLSDDAAVFNSEYDSKADAVLQYADPSMQASPRLETLGAPIEIEQAFEAHELDLDVSTSQPQLSASIPSLTASVPDSRVSRDSWLANVEIRTFDRTSHEVPLWASPQFNLCTYQSPASSSSLDILFDDKVTSQPVAYSKHSRFTGLRSRNPDGIADEISAALGAEFNEFEISVSPTNAKSSNDGCSRVELTESGATTTDWKLVLDESYADSHSAQKPALSKHEPTDHKEAQPN